MQILPHCYDGHWLLRTSDRCHALILSNSRRPSGVDLLNSRCIQSHCEGFPLWADVGWDWDRFGVLTFRRLRSLCVNAAVRASSLLFVGRQWHSYVYKLCRPTRGNDAFHRTSPCPWVRDCLDLCSILRADHSCAVLGWDWIVHRMNDWMESVIHQRRRTWLNSTVRHVNGHWFAKVAQVNSSYSSYWPEAFPN